MGKHKPPVKLCPYVTTAQVVPLQINGMSQPVQSQSVDANALKTGALLRPGGGALTPTGITQIHAGYTYKTKKGSPKDNPQFIGDPVSVPCMRATCRLWCEEHSSPACGPGCPDCQLDLMTKSFTAALEAAPKLE